MCTSRTRAVLSLFATSFAASALHAQTSGSTLTCQSSAQPVVVRAEGVTERLGDIVLTCGGGQPNQIITGNFTIFVNALVTNQLSTGNNLNGIVFTADNGTGPLSVPSTPQLGPNGSLIFFNGASFTLSPTGATVLRFSNIRANVSQLPAGALVFAYAALNNPLPVNTPQFEVARGLPSLFVSFAGKLICTQAGSKVPNSTSLADFVVSGALFSTTRVTEGFASALEPLTGWSNFNAGTGDRILVTFSGLPSSAQIYVPDVIAGSDAVKPTSGGGLGVPSSGGQWAPSVSGSLLLARVNGADANGTGGVPVFSAATGASTFDTVSALANNGGTSYAVYEVIDANSGAQEFAQFPAFLSLPPGSGTGSEVGETVMIAPISQSAQASTTAPIPRFVESTPAPDCSVLGDCSAGYFPQLQVLNTLPLTAAAGSRVQTNYVPIHNTGGGVMSWTATVAYTTGAGWLQISPQAGVNNSTLRIDANPQNLTPGTYQAVITIAAGAAGTQTIAVTLTVTQASVDNGGTPATPSGPTVQSVVNGASFAQGAVVPGSITTIMGANFTGHNVDATFDGMRADVLFSNAGQINIVVPVALAGASTAKMIVWIDGVSSTPQTVNVAPFAPAIFNDAVLNQDYTVNGTDHPAAPGSVVQIFATGLSGTGTITARIGDRDVPAPYYAGAAPGLTGVQQVNLAVPADFAGTTTEVMVCGTAAGAAPVCSVPQKLVVGQ